MSYLVKIIIEKKSHLSMEKEVTYTQKDNKKFLDFVQGIAVNSLGHAHPKLIKTINNQSKNFGMFQMPFKFQREKNWPKDL